jgi:hypothetical protein
MFISGQSPVTSKLAVMLACADVGDRAPARRQGEL